MERVKESEYVRGRKSSSSQGRLEIEERRSFKKGSPRPPPIKVQLRDYLREVRIPAGVQRDNDRRWVHNLVETGPCRNDLCLTQ